MFIIYNSTYFIQIAKILKCMKPAESVFPVKAFSLIQVRLTPGYMSISRLIFVEYNNVYKVGFTFPNCNVNCTINNIIKYL